MSDRIDGLRDALEASPGNTTIRLILAEALRDGGEAAEAISHYEILLAAGGLTPVDAVAVAHFSLDHGRLDVARGCLESARERGEIDGITEADARLAAAMAAITRTGPAVESDAPGDPFDHLAAGQLGPGSVPAAELLREESVRFADVGGLEDLKKVLHRLIVMPYVRPDLYAKYGRRAGGGVMLYGPPGCGKTLIARAIAGECGLPFFPIRIEDVVSEYFGASERNLADIFEQARANAPCVVFIDEMDAIAYKRHRAGGDSARRLTNVLLQQLDGVGSDTTDMLVVGASNAPWDVDSALSRPGRFERRVFVPPPDDDARRAIVETLLHGIHADASGATALAARTDFYSGADLRAVVDRAAEYAIEHALDTGDDQPIGTSELLGAAAEVRPTTLDWLRRARDFLEFADSDEWDDVRTFLKKRPIRKRL
ncbi:ATPase family protein associated with various cellular activities (AAA) [Mumia flava]|uniref:ATPase family protein associated with various cellular activities (AAA) n=1 Tax=Mumia flava TaxID=1348852 RepID=A0A0B2BLA8_9ACTN|nr:ATP-binding protein [Mumia flava]PJJ54022.1 ATPase family protein associated with various cellular activities (AAA) [Mumia flava]